EQIYVDTTRPKSTQVNSSNEGQVKDDTMISESTQVFSSNNRTEGDTSATSFSLESTHDDKAVDGLDRLTIRSRASGVTLGLPESEEQQLVTIFVQQLWQVMYKDAALGSDEEVDEETLETLLKSYSRLMSQTVPASTQFEKGAVDFIRSRRKCVLL